MKKLVLTAVCAAAFSSGLFAGTSYKAFSKAFCDDVILSHEDGHDTVVDFPAAKNEVYAELLTDKIDAMIDAYVMYDDIDGKNFGFMWDMDSFDWYVEIRPFKNITLGLHDDIFAKGSYLPVWDDNISSGNIGSEGATLVYSIDNVRLAVTAPFGDNASEANYCTVEDENGDTKYLDTGVGAIVDTRILQIGASVQHVLDDDKRTMGFYLSTPDFFGLVKPLSFNAGIAKSEGAVSHDNFISMGPVKAGVSGDTYLSAGIKYTGKKFLIKGDAVSNFVEDFGTVTDIDGKTSAVYQYDFYTGVSVAFALNKNLTATAAGKLCTDLSDDKDNVKAAKNAYEASFNLDVAIDKRQSAGVGIDCAECDSSWALSLPIYWKYKF